VYRMHAEIQAGISSKLRSVRFYSCLQNCTVLTTKVSDILKYMFLYTQDF